MYEWACLSDYIDIFICLYLVRVSLGSNVLKPKDLLNWNVKDGRVRIG